MNKLILISLALFLVACGKNNNSAQPEAPEVVQEKSYICSYRETAIGSICVGGFNTSCFPGMVKYYDCVEEISAEACVTTTKTNDEFEKTDCSSLSKEDFFNSIIN